MGKIYSHKTELEPLFVRSFKQVIIRLHEKEKKYQTYYNYLFYKLECFIGICTLEKNRITVREKL